MSDIGMAVGHLFAWWAWQARPAEDRRDLGTDHDLGPLLDGLHDLVGHALGQDPALERAAEEARAGRHEPTERTRRRLTDSLEDAAERDQDFAAALRKALLELRAAAAAAAGRGGQAVGGSVHITSQNGSAAAVRIREVTMGSASDPHGPGPEQG